MLARADGSSAELPSKVPYGDPKERDREAARSDLADGFVSEQAARAVYGLEPDGGD